MKRYFCTYFDENYLTRGLALYESLSKHCYNFELYILCLSDVCFTSLVKLNLRGVRLIKLEELEVWDPELLKAKNNRTRIEYFFTCTPVLPRYIFDKFAGIDMVSYVDADLYFFHSLDPIFDLMKDASVGIVPHRFPPEMAHLAEHGIFNVGLVTFKNDSVGNDVLADWSTRCLAWCYDRVEDGKFADQKYLDAWPQHKGVRILEPVGIGLAPWNMKQYQYKFDGNALVDGQPLIFFHYHGFRRVSRFFYEPGLKSYSTSFTAFFKQRIFKPYAAALQRAEDLVGQTGAHRTIARSSYKSHPIVFLADLVRGRFLFFPARNN